MKMANTGYVIPKGWTMDEVEILAKYAVLNKTPVQLQMDIFRKFGNYRRIPEIMGALKTAGIEKKLLPQNLGFLDIETTGLNADYGFVINWYIKSADKHNTAFQQCRCKPVFDSWLITAKDILQRGVSDLYGIKKLLETLPKYDLVIGHYSSRFDVPYIKTKALAWVREGKLPPNVMDVLGNGRLVEADNWVMARNNLKLHSNRQESLIEMFNTGIKTRLNPKAWIGAGFGNKAALDYVDQHCRTDVQALERNWDLMTPFLPYKFRTAKKNMQMV